MSNIDLQTTVRKPLGGTYAFIIMLILVLSGLLVYNLFDYVTKEKTAIESARKEAEEKTQLAADKMNEHFKLLQQIASQQVRELEAKQYSKKEIEERIYTVLKKNPEVFGFAIAYKPYKYDTQTRLYGPYCDRQDGTIRKIQIEDIYDYTREDKAGQYWYVKTLQEGAGWTEPYFGDASQRLLSEYCVPFYGLDPVTGKREIVGVIDINFSIDDIEKYIKDLDFGGRGYAYLISREGTYISHPTKENVIKQRKFSKNTDGIDLELARKLLFNNGTLYDFTNKQTGQEAWVIHQSVTYSGYELGAVFIKDAMIKDKDLARHKFIIVSVLAILILALFSILVTKGHQSTDKRLWSISIFISALLVVGIAAVWFISTKYNTYSDSEVRIVTDEATVRGMVDELAEKSKSIHMNKPILIPTGVYIQSLEFENANNVKLTGYVWQKYTRDIPDTISREIVFPESIAGFIEKAYVREDLEGETIGWHFEATLRQEFNYSKYPLDNKDVWLRMWPKDFDKNVILIPDFRSYKQINPDDKPGIDKDIILAGWDIKQSFFCYYTNGSYNTNFGIRDYVGQDKFPELAFMALISRKFMNPFISYLLPFVVMAFMLFGTLALIYVIEFKAEKFKFSATGVLAACTGLFFSVVITHNRLRESITVNGVLYLEYFYFVMYAAIVLVIIDAFMVAFNRNSWFVQYKDNIIPKILYWPSMLAVILAITIGLFYN